MGTKTVILKAESFAQWTDPFNNKIQHCHFYSPVASLPEKMPIETVNTRAQNIEQPLYQQVIRSAINNPESFHHKNGGMFITVRKFQFDKNKKTITLHFGESDGVGDGGHSYLSCIEARKRFPEIKSFITVKIVTNLDEKTLKGTCLSRNSNISNKLSTRMNYSGDFDFIKDAVKNEPYADFILYKENEKNKRIPIKHIVSILSLFKNGSSLQNGKPYWVYGKKGKVLSEFSQEMKKETGNCFFKMKKIIPDILRLYDLIYLEIANESRSVSIESGQFSLVTSALFKHGHQLYFLGKKTDKQISNALIFPILYAFSSMIKINKNGDYEWIGGFKQAERQLQRKIKDLVKISFYHVQKHNGFFTALGKSRDFWDDIFSCFVNQDSAVKQGKNTRRAKLVSTLKDLTESQKKIVSIIFDHYDHKKKMSIYLTVPMIAELSGILANTAQVLIFRMKNRALLDTVERKNKNLGVKYRLAPALYKEFLQNK